MIVLPGLIPLAKPVRFTEPSSTGPTQIGFVFDRRDAAWAQSFEKLHVAAEGNGVTPRSFRFFRFYFLQHGPTTRPAVEKTVEEAFLVLSLFPILGDWGIPILDCPMNV